MELPLGAAAQSCEAVLVSITDGDTVHMDIVESASAVFHTKHWIIGRRYRLARINAPEMSTGAGQQSATALRQKCATYPPLGWTVVTSKQDPYGRYIAEVIAPDGVNLSDWMLANGYAVAVTYKLAHDGERLIAEPRLPAPPPADPDLDWSDPGDPG